MVKRIYLWFSLLISLLVLFSSLSGIFNPAVYLQESANWAMQAVGQDIGNLLAVIVLLVSTYFLARNSVISLFVWLGTLFYFLYAFIIYAFFVHFNFLFLVYVAVLGLSFYSIIGVLAGQDWSKLTSILTGKRTGAVSFVLILTGLMFALLWLSEIIPALINGTLPPSLKGTGLWVNPIQVIDLSVVLPGMIITGILLDKKKLYGCFFAAPWLMFSVLMGSSIVATMILQLKTGDSAAIPPLTIVSLIVIASLLVLKKFLVAK